MEQAYIDYLKKNEKAWAPYKDIIVVSADFEGGFYSRQPEIDELKGKHKTLEIELECFRLENLRHGDEIDELKAQLELRTAAGIVSIGIL